MACQTPAMAPVRIAQLSDTHFLEDGAEAEGGAAYDTDAAFDAVFEHLAGLPFSPDLVVVTGDVADHGRPAQYRKAADALARFDVPVVACPGNHDFVVPFTAGMGRASVHTSRVVEIGSWAFVFADTTTGLMESGPGGLPVDPPGEIRLHSNGSLGSAEAALIESLCHTTEAEHVFLWVHHPPAPLQPISYDEAYVQQWQGLLGQLPPIAGIGAGHTHVPDAYEFEKVPVFVAPSLKNNFSMEPQTWLPPGYRTYEFAADGTVTSELHLVDDERWPRRPFGRAIASLFNGELSYDQLAEIATRQD